MRDAQADFEAAHQLMQQSSGGARLSDAADLMKAAADRGHAGAAKYYGAMLQHGSGVAMDLSEARAYYARAAEAGLAAGVFK